MYSFITEKERKFQAVSTTVWVCLKAAIAEKTIKEALIKKYSNDNYRLRGSSLLYLPINTLSKLISDFLPHVAQTCHPANGATPLFR